jgi:hypothetical protein
LSIHLVIGFISILPWKKAQPASKVAVALAWLWSCREDRTNALVRITEILDLFGDGGDQIERLWREFGGTELPSGFVGTTERRSQMLTELKLSVNLLRETRDLR